MRLLLLLLLLLLDDTTRGESSASAVMDVIGMECVGLLVVFSNGEFVTECVDSKSSSYRSSCALCEALAA